MEKRFHFLELKGKKEPRDYCPFVKDKPARLLSPEENPIKILRRKDIFE